MTAWCIILKDTRGSFLLGKRTGVLEEHNGNRRYNGVEIDHRV